MGLKFSIGLIFGLASRSKPRAASYFPVLLHNSPSGSCPNKEESLWSINRGKKSEASGQDGFAQLLDAVWCPICGARLALELREGKRLMVCPRHGEMKPYLDRDPMAAADSEGV